MRRVLAVLVGLLLAWVDWRLGADYVVPCASAGTNSATCSPDGSGWGSHGLDIGGNAGGIFVGEALGLGVLAGPIQMDPRAESAPTSTLRTTGGHLPQATRNSSPRAACFPTWTSLSRATTRTTTTPTGMPTSLARASGHGSPGREQR